MENMNFDDSKAVELLVEQKKLQETIDIINQEILIYINKRKYITEYILDYRKKLLRSIEMMKIRL